MPKSSQLRQFACPESNACSMATPIDWCGRFLLPLDSVWYDVLTDEGIVLCIPGRVLSLQGTGVELEPEVGLRLRFNLPNHFREACNVVRVPSDPQVESEMVRYFVDYNRHSCLKYGQLHLNGELIHAY